jgi:hypothetical protein
MNLSINKSGAIMYQVLIFGAVALMFIGGLISWSGSNIRFGHNLYNREVALTIAEAGAEYYRWHLAHDPTDFQDGTGGPGPYVHLLTDAGGNQIGRFELTITPPPVGSSIVTISSAGYVDEAPTVKRTVDVIMAKPSLAKYAVVANADIRFGSGTEIFGPIHSNGGIRFDGLTHNLITSTKSSYNDPDHEGGEEFGVHTHINPIDPLPPAAVPSRTDVFEVGRQFPTPAIDFSGFTADLANIKTAAQASGLYLPSSGASGYHLILKTNDTVDIYTVNSTTAPPLGCKNQQGETGWNTWSVNAETFDQNLPLPTNGAIFVEDHLWVDGQVDTARVTVASARFPEDPVTNTSITVNNDLLYTNIDGQDVISLIAQNNLNVGLVSDDDLRIDAALIAKNGRIGRYYYGINCSPNHIRNSVTAYGILVTNQRYGWAWSDGTGYQNRYINYDSNLLYSPPPFFPLTSDQYETISWREIQ